MPNPYFDLLARIVGNHLPQARLLLHRARLFDFPHRAHEVLPKTFAPGQRQQLQDHFFLPFDAVAVEDTGSVVALFDSEPEQQGLGGKRYFIEGLPMSQNNPDEYRPEDRELIEKTNPLFDNAPPDYMSITLGFIENISLVNEQGDMQFDGKVELAVFATPEAVLLDLTQEWARTRQYQESPDLAKRERGALRARDEEQFRVGTLRNVNVALQEVMLFNSPDRFVVECEPPRWPIIKSRLERKKDLRKRPVLRSHERPTYILLTPDEIRERFHFPTQTGTAKRAHERRRHFRTYPDDPKRFPNAHGKTIVVPATWVGPSEKKIDGRRYRVLLDI